MNASLSSQTGRRLAPWAVGAGLLVLMALVIWLTQRETPDAALHTAAETRAMATAGSHPAVVSAPGASAAREIPNRAPVAESAQEAMPGAAQSSVAQPPGSQPTAPADTVTLAQAAAVEAVPAAAVPAAAVPAAAVPAEKAVVAEVVKITFNTVPRANATVDWGKHRLGAIQPSAPLVVERPRDSGPLDVIIRAGGYLPVSVRAYTFNDSVVEVRVTPRSKKDTLYGYRIPLPPEPAAEGGSLEEPDL